MATFNTTIRPTPFGFFEFSHERRNDPGVYVIYFEDCNYYYVGSSNKCSHRISQHLCELKVKRHANKFLQRVYNKHHAAMRFCFAYQASRYMATLCEQKILDKCYHDDFCLNLSSDATVPKHSIEGRQKLREKAILQHQRNGFNLEAVARYHRSLGGRKMHSECAKRQRLDPQYTKRLTNILRLKLQKYYDITLVNENGVTAHIGWNLREFCRTSGLDRGNLLKMIKGKLHSVKGWRIKNG